MSADARDEDDFTHYFNAAGRLTRENSELRAEVERLQTVLASWQRVAKDLEAEIKRLQHEWAVVCNEYGQLRAENAQLRAALDPFARVADVLDALPELLPDDTPLRDVMPRIWPTVSDAREARRALEQARKE